MDPLDAIEAHQGMSDVADLMGTFRKRLIENDFREDDAVDICIEWMHGRANVEDVEDAE